MSRRTFQRVPVRRADFGPAQPGYRITCGQCRATDEVIVKGTLVDVGQRFRASGWLVGDREDDDRCPSHNLRWRSPRKEALPMVKITKTAPIEGTARPVLSAPVAAVAGRSEEARRARLDVDLLLVDNFDPVAGRYKPDWDDERVARDAGMSVDFVAKRREAEHGPLRRDVPVERLATLVEESTALDAALKGRLDEAVRRVQEAAVAVAGVVTDVRQSLAARNNALRKIIDGK